MDTVNIGDKPVARPEFQTKTHGCAHARAARCRWDATENPPQLVFENMPSHGVLILSKSRVVVCCRLCWEAGWGLRLV